MISFSITLHVHIWKKSNNFKITLFIILILVLNLKRCLLLNNHCHKYNIFVFQLRNPNKAAELRKNSYKAVFWNKLTKLTESQLFLNKTIDQIIEEKVFTTGWCKKKLYS